MKQIIREGNLYKVLEDNSVIYQTTEGLLLLHWLQRHPATYGVNATINLGAQNERL